MSVAHARAGFKADTVDSRCDWNVADRPTIELLRIVLDAAYVALPDLDEIARAIDEGNMAMPAAMPDDASIVAALSVPAATMLMASFELARRAAVAPAPAVIHGPADVAEIARRELGGRSRECVLVIACDASIRVRQSVVVSQGAADRALFPVREILNAVLRCDGRAFALAHNHPFGDSTPGDADVIATQYVAAGARVAGLRFLGHVVVAGDCHRLVPVT